MLSPVGDGQPFGENQTLGHFALVSYIPDPLARFLDELREELTPGCRPRAHVTILPPRPLRGSLRDAVEQLADDVRQAAPFRVEPGDIEVFEESNVVYLGLSRGMSELRKLYARLNRRALQFTENFPYHPHITIAQNPLPGQAPGLAAVARERWARYQGPRGFAVTSLSFVQHVAPSIWADVAALPLGLEVPVAL